MTGKRLLWVLAALALFVWLRNSSWLHGTTGRDPQLLAHRGLGQTFPIAGLGGSDDTSKLIYEPEHPYLENTIAGMEAAFRHGADIVELDVQLTADGRFAVFHDELLDFRTNGTGRVRAHSLEALQALDVGFGYSADGGNTYPFRGKGVGLMPSLDAVLERFPDEELLLDIKGRVPEEGEALAALLADLPEERRAKLAAYGGNAPIATIAAALPGFRVMSRATVTNAGLTYLALGWTGHVPANCRGTQLHIPLRYSWLLWGWPHRFLDRMHAVDTRVVLVAGAGPWSEGFDSRQDLRAIPEGYSGVIWTNRIDRIGPLLK
jgi:glycerophosphoryl diester phosphodiesterase